MNTPSFHFHKLSVGSFRFGPLLCVAIMVAGVCLQAKHSDASEPSVAYQESSGNAESDVGFRRELVQLLERDSNTKAWLDLLKRAYAEGELLALASPQQLPWTTWTYSGWRLELITKCGERLILAADAGALVVIRQGKNIEMSAMDLIGPAGSNRRSRFGNGASTHHVTARSASHLATKSPYLAPLYYYFVGPTDEVLPSHALPPAAFQLFR